MNVTVGTRVSWPGQLESHEALKEGCILARLVLSRDDKRERFTWLGSYRDRPIPDIRCDVDILSE